MNEHMAVELRHLRYFVTVAEEGHITRAAERLGMQQPPLSQLIKGIERDLKVQLFRRKPRGVELTAAGHALFDDARTILDRLGQAFEKTQRAARGEQGQIRVGISGTGIYHPFVPKVIRGFREAYPLVSVTLVEGLSNELMDQLRNERVDAIFIRSPPADQTGLVVEKLLEEPMVLALPTWHPLARRYRTKAIPLEALADETFIATVAPVTLTGTGARAAAYARYRQAGFNLRTGQQVPRTRSAISFVAAGLGITFVPASLQRLRIDGVTYRRLQGAAQMAAALVLVSRRGDPSPVVRQFAALVRNSAKKEE